MRHYRTGIQLQISFVGGISCKELERPMTKPDMTGGLACVPYVSARGVNLMHTCNPVLPNVSHFYTLLD